MFGLSIFSVIQPWPVADNQTFHQRRLQRPWFFFGYRNTITFLPSILKCTVLVNSSVCNNSSILLLRDTTPLKSCSSPLVSYTTSTLYHRSTCRISSRIPVS